MWEWVTYFFVNSRVLQKHLPTFHFPHLFRPKTIKVKVPCQIKSSDNQSNPTVLKKCKTKEFSTKYTTFPKLLSIVIAKIKSSNEKQFPTLYPVNRK